MSAKVLKIDFSKNRFRERVEKYYGEGNYLSALRFAHKQAALYGDDVENLVMISDIYESMGLYSSAINTLFKYMDNCAEEDLPEVYEGLAVNYLNLGNDAQSAFYYDKLLDTDDTISEENKEEIADYFHSVGRENFRFVYPPQLADYTKETSEGAAALRQGDTKKAIEYFSVVEKGSKEYESAKEMEAVAYLLSGDAFSAEKICLTLRKEYPKNIHIAATLAAVYTEEGRKEESKKIALELCKKRFVNMEEKYKIATVACENSLHKEALEMFTDLEKEFPYDGNLLYFKGVAAFESGNIDLCEKSFEKLCSIYPDAAVAEYYLKEIRRYKDSPQTEKKPELTYFYRVPSQERELRCRALASLGKYSKNEAQALGSLFDRKGFFRWCFDEMDGMEHDLQYLGIVVAEKAEIDSFLREVLLDSQVKDVLKIEILRLLYMRNRENVFGVVICNIYRSVYIRKIKLGVKKRKNFLDGYAKIASKFALIKDENANKIQEKTEGMYEKFKEKECWNLAENPNDLCCALYLLCGFTEAGTSSREAAPVFEANAVQVDKIMAVALSY